MNTAPRIAKVALYTLGCTHARTHARTQFCHVVLGFHESNIKVKKNVYDIKVFLSSLQTRCIENPVSSLGLGRFLYTVRCVL